MNPLSLVLMTLFRWLFLAAVLGLMMLCGLAHGQTYVYSQNGNILYEKYQEAYTYYSYGVPYTGYRWAYRKIADVGSKDWRQSVLNLIDREKERQAFQSALGHIAPGVLAPQTPQAAAYPSAVGNTLGGFTKLEYSKFGNVEAFDVNRAWEKSQQGADTVSRMASELHVIAQGTATQAAGLQQSGQQIIGAVAETQELRAANRELMAGLKEQALAQAEILKSLRASPQESLRIESGHSSSSGGGGPIGPGPVPPPPPVPPGGGGAGRWNADMAAVVKQFCASCHNAGSPQGDFILADGTPISTQQFGSLALRMDPNAPEKRQSGAAYRMPPADSPQPSVEERRIIVDAAKVLVAP